MRYRMTSDARRIGERDDAAYDLPYSYDRSPVVRAVLARWKHAAVAVVLALTAWQLFVIGGGWTLDATVFALAAAGVVAYSLLTLRSDLA